MRPWLSIILTISVLLFTLGALLCFLLTILTGATQASVMKHFYWLRVDTSSLSTDYSSTKWTNYGICDAVANTCKKNSAAYPFSPSDNFGKITGLPSAFISQRKTFYYLSRIGYGFSLVGLFFLVVSIVPIWLFILFGKMALLSLISFSVAFLFILTSVVLSTAAYAKGKHTFQDAGFHSKLGPSTFGVAWTTIALLILILTILIIRLFGERIESANWSRNRRKRRETYYSNNEWELRRQQMVNQDQYANERGGVNFMHLIEQNEVEGGNNVRAAQIVQSENTGNKRVMNFFRVKRNASNTDNGEIIEREQQYQHEDNITSNTASPNEELYYKEESSTVGGTGETFQYYQEQHETINQIPQIDEEPAYQRNNQVEEQQQQQQQVIPQELYPREQTFVNTKAMTSTGELVEKDTAYDAPPTQLHGESITDSSNTQRNSRNTLDPAVLSDIDDRYPGDTNRLSGQSGLETSENDYLESIQERYQN